MYEVHIINNFPLEIFCHMAVIDYYTRTSNGDIMVIRREDSGVSSLKNLEAWRWPPRRSVAVPTRVHVDRFSNFSKGVK